MILGNWFAPGDHIEAVERIENDTVADCERVGYRFRVNNDDGAFLVEQQAYLRADESGINWLRVMCAGYRPIDATGN